MDEDLAYFLEKFGEPTHRTKVPAASVATWRGRLPDYLLSYWIDEGWCGYARGLLWTVDPDDYEDLVDEWLADSPLEQVDAYHVIARSAFGDLYLCGERSGRSATVNCLLNAISALAKDLKAKDNEARDRSIRSFFASSALKRFDFTDGDGVPLFERALNTLGALAPDEMYGFEPALVAGGANRLQNLRKLKIDPHLTILRQFGAPSMPFSNADIGRDAPNR